MFKFIFIMSRKRNWCFTNYDPEAKFLLWNHIDDLPSSIAYICWQDEICPSTNRLHQQGYAEFRESTRIGTVKRLLGCESIHLEGRVGTAEQAREYCKKEETGVEGSFKELGIFSKSRQGTRNDLEEITEMLREGRTVDEITDLFGPSYIRYHRGIENLNSRFRKRAIPGWRSVQVFVLWGDTGIGKTRLVHELFGPKVFTLAAEKGDRVWWDGYEGERVLLIDEFYGWVPYGTFLQITDGYRVRLPIKGSHTYSAWNVVVITSNKSPEEWYSFGQPPAMRRRLDTGGCYEIRGQLDLSLARAALAESCGRVEPEGVGERSGVQGGDE